MEWVYKKEPPDTTILKYLEKQIGDKEIAYKLERLLNLYSFLRSQNFKNAKEIQQSAFYDDDHKRPIFDEKLSKALLRLIRQTGGTSPEAQVLDKGVRSVLNYAGTWVPDIVVNVTQNVYPYVTVLKTLQENSTIGPLVDIAKEVAVQSGKTAIVAASQVAAEVGGPVGTAAVAIPAAITGVLIVVTHIMEDELGEALLASFLILPFVGPILYKAAMSFGKVAKKASDRKSQLVNVPLIGSLANDYIPDLKEGGKRFSTRKHRSNKWKTKRRRFVKH